MQCKQPFVELYNQAILDIARRIQGVEHFSSRKICVRMTKQDGFTVLGDTITVRMVATRRLFDRLIDVLRSNVTPESIIREMDQHAAKKALRLSTNDFKHFMSAGATRLLEVRRDELAETLITLGVTKSIAQDLVAHVIQQRSSIIAFMNETDDVGYDPKVPSLPKPGP